MPQDETSQAAARISVLAPAPLAGAFDYRVDPDRGLKPGDFVRVPLGGRSLAGVVWDASANDGKELPAARLRDVGPLYDAPAMSEPMRRFIDWVAAYTMAPKGAVLRMAMSAPEALDRPAPAQACRLSAAAPGAEDADLRLTKARRRVLAELRGGPPRPLAELARAAGVGPAVVRGLMGIGWVELVEVAPDAARLPAVPAPPVLSSDQAEAAAALAAKLDQGFSVTLIDGVTGSGKTEVYFEAIAANLAAGRQSLVLVPEIALGAQWLARFNQRFGEPASIWHSEVSPAQRRRTWRAVAEGRARVVVGARSALFLPFARLCLIVVDEEHEAAFKQEEGVMYHARDMAVVRARFEKIPAVLVSATPALETAVNVQRGRYGALHLPDRFGGAALPQIAALDLRREQMARNSFIAPALRTALVETLAAGEQALLFLNRRGYAPLTLCRACGHRLNCPSCSAWLVEHRRTGGLLCHHCGYTAKLPATCPKCEAEGRFVACGPGVERVAEEAALLFPDARVALATSDTLERPAAAQDFLTRMEAREIDLVIGTQIVAKGHHFPYLTLVGVIDADLGLSGGDLRAAERTYQLLHQVAGRAGRAERPGRALLQTWMPEHPVMRALVQLSHDSSARDRFIAAETEDRQRHLWPPFGRLAAVIVSGPDEGAVQRTARQLGATAPHGGGVEVLGPAPAPLSLLRGRRRMRLLVKTARETDLQGVIGDWLVQTKPPSNVRIQVDIDPYSFM